MYPCEVKYLPARRSIGCSERIEQKKSPREREGDIELFSVISGTEKVCKL